MSIFKNVEYAGIGRYKSYPGELAAAFKASVNGRETIVYTSISVADLEEGLKGNFKPSGLHVPSAECAAAAAALKQTLSDLQHGRIRPEQLPDFENVDQCKVSLLYQPKLPH